MSAPLTREERTDRLADLRAREAVRKVTLSGVPLMDLPLERRIAFAVFDPGAITPRGDNYKEPLFRWQARAITYVMPEAHAEVARLQALVAEMHAAAVGEVKPPLLGLVEDVAATRSALAAQQQRADTLDGIAREMAKRVAELEDAAYGDATVRLLEPVDQIQHLHASVAAQMARADTLNRLALQHRARVAELEAELEAERNERCPAFQGDGDLCTACGDARRWHRATEAGESE